MGMRERAFSSDELDALAERHGITQAQAAALVWSHGSELTEAAAAAVVRAKKKAKPEPE